MLKAKENVKIGNLALTIRSNEICVFTDSSGAVLAKISIGHNCRISKAPIFIQAPVNIRVSRKPAPRVSNVAGTHVV